MPHQPLNIKIDKLTQSIEDAISGVHLETEVLNLQSIDILKLKKKDWIFNWKKESEKTENHIYKLVLINNSDIIQGLISLQDRHDHVFISLIESSKINRGSQKIYLGVPGNLVAFACKYVV